MTNENQTELILNENGKVTTLELVKQINVFRYAIENKNALAHKTMLQIVRDEFEEEISQQKIMPSNYISGRGKEYPMFELTVSQAKQVLVRESKVVRKAVIKRLEQLENAGSKLVEAIRDSYTIVDPIERAKRWIEEEEARKQLTLTVQEKTKEIAYKNEIIQVLTEDVDIFTMRTVLNRICKNVQNKSQIRDRYNQLYRVFQETHHINLKARCEGYNMKQKSTKDNLSVIGYAEHAGYIRQLYEVAVKLYETDVNLILAEITK